MLINRNPPNVTKQNATAAPAHDTRKATSTSKINRTAKSWRPHGKKMQSTSATSVPHAHWKKSRAAAIRARLWARPTQNSRTPVTPPQSLPRAVLAVRPVIISEVPQRPQDRPLVRQKMLLRKSTATIGTAYRKTPPPPCSAYRMMPTTAQNWARRAVN